MSRISKLVTSAAVILLMAACSTGRDKLVARQQYEGFIQAGTGQEQVALPPGNWSLVSWEVYSNDQDIGGVLIETDGNRVSRIVDFYVRYITLGNPKYLRLPPYKFCGRRDILHMGKSFTGGGYYFSKGIPQDCWGIDHRPMTFSGSVPKHLLALRDYIEENGLILPATMIGVHYRRAGKPGDWLSANYYFNPELEGFPPPSEVNWRTNDWHRDRAFRDPQKKAYIEKLVEWGVDWHAEVDRGFKGLLKRGGS